MSEEEIDGGSWHIGELVDLALRAAYIVNLSVAWLEYKRLSGSPAVRAMHIRPLCCNLSRGMRTNRAGRQLLMQPHSGIRSW